MTHLSTTPSSYRIIGVDVGSVNMGAAVLAVSHATGEGTFLDYQALRLRGKYFGERLKDGEEQLLRIIKEHAPVHAMIWEGVHLGHKNPKTMGQLAKAVGLVELLAVKYANIGFEVDPNAARSRIGPGNAGYPLLQELIEEKYGIDTSTFSKDKVSAMVQAESLRVLFNGRRVRQGMRIVFQKHEKGLMPRTKQKLNL